MADEAVVGRCHYQGLNAREDRRGRCVTSGEVEVASVGDGADEGSVPPLPITHVSKGDTCADGRLNEATLIHRVGDCECTSTDRVPRGLEKAVAPEKHTERLTVCLVRARVDERVLRAEVRCEASSVLKHRSVLE